MDKLTQTTNNRIEQILNRAYYHQISLNEARDRIHVYSDRIAFYNKKYLEYKKSAEKWHQVVSDYFNSFEVQKKKLLKENEHLKDLLKHDQPKTADRQH